MWPRDAAGKMTSTAPTAPPPPTSYEGLASRARALSAAAPGDTQVCIGVGGGPGAGKTTAATAVVELVNAAEGPSTAVMIPMDGFHYTRAELRAMAAGGAGRHPKNGTAGSPGARAYQLVHNEDTVVFPTKTIISTVKVHAAAQHLDRDSDPATMWLSEADHESILEHPMELIAQWERQPAHSTGPLTVAHHCHRTTAALRLQLAIPVVTTTKNPTLGNASIVAIDHLCSQRTATSCNRPRRGYGCFTANAFAHVCAGLGCSVPPVSPCSQHPRELPALLARNPYFTEILVFCESQSAALPLPVFAHQSEI